MAAHQTTILLIDDYPNLGKSFALLFEGRYTVLHALDEREAETYLRQDRIELILLDHQLNGSKDGLDLADEYRNLYPHIPIIIYTGYADENVIETCREKAIPLIVKPVEREDCEYMVCYLMHFHSGETLEKVLEVTNNQCGTPSFEKEISPKDYPEQVTNWFKDCEKKGGKKGTKHGQK